MFFDNFIFLCQEHGISPTNLLLDIGISKGNLSRWRDGGVPRNETAKKIADYFGISVSELMAGEINETKKAPTNNVEAVDEVKELLEEARSRPEIRALFSVSRNATPDDIRTAIRIIKALQEDEYGGDNY